MAASFPFPLQESLFELLKAKLGAQVPTVSATKSTLVHLSHTLEDIILREKIPAMLFTGFQESSHWRKETERYRELAGVAQQVCIFAGKPLPEESEAKQLHIELAEGDLLRQEWFVLILSDRFSVLLCGLDNLTPTPSEATREFETIWSFEAANINMTLDILENVIAHYRPERLTELQQARQQFTYTSPDPLLLSRFTLELIHFEEQLNAELRWQTTITNNLLQSMTHFVFVWKITPDGDRQLNYVSPNIDRLLPYKVGEIMENWQTIIGDRLHPDDRPIIQKLMEAHKTQSSYSAEYRIYGGDDEIIWLRNSSNAEYDPSDGGTLLYAVVEDITSYKAAQEYQRAQEQLRLELENERQLNSIKSHFMTTVSHEFRTPLATILSSTELLSRYADRYTEDERHRKLTTIRTQVLHLTKMLEDITAVFNNQQENLTFKPESTNVKQFFEAIIQDFKLTQITQHHIVFEFTGQEQECLVDTLLLRTIVSNLLSNAVKYSPDDSKIRFTLTIDQKWMIFSVADQGIGIPEEDRALVFDAFHRGQNVGNRQGMGLGLRIVSDCVALHRGAITYESPSNGGSVFWVRIPAVFG